jgi:tRNA-Thr(GGU) m(6)t(6)A37 methyltransferase TsaA
LFLQQGELGFMVIELTPIGEVQNDIDSLNRVDEDTGISQIVVYEQFVPALDCIEGFSDILIFYWMDRLSPHERSIMKVHPQGREDMPLVGVFACRSPARPNPIGVTRVKLLERRDNVVEVSGLDAANGSPVIDIKPYIPRTDLTGEVVLPDWVGKLK